MFISIVWGENVFLKLTLFESLSSNEVFLMAGVEMEFWQSEEIDLEEDASNLCFSIGKFCLPESLSWSEYTRIL